MATYVEFNITGLVITVSSGFPGKTVLADSTVTWTGSSSSDWFDMRNWSTGSVPTSSDFAEINTTSPNSPVISTDGVAEIDALIVGDDKTGSLTIENGGTLTVDEIAIAEEGGTGTIVVTGSGSTLSIGNEINIADEGTGTLTIADGATVSVGGVDYFIMGSDSKATANLNIGAASGDTAVAPGTLTADAITVSIADEANFVFNHTGTEADNYTFSSAISVDSGSENANIQVESGYTIMSGDNSNFGKTVVVDGGTLVVTNNFASSAITVGDSNTGSELIVESAGAIALDGDLTIGNSSASSGTVTITGSGASLSVTGSLLVGNEGTGALTVASGATATVNDGTGTLTIASHSSSSGSVAIGAASGSTATEAGTISAAEIAFGSGTGTLVFNHTATSSDALDFTIPISGKGAIEVQSGYTELSADNSGFSGTASVDGGTLAITGNLKGTGLVVGDTGTDAALTISAGAEADISGDAIIGAEAGSSGSLTVTASTLNVSGSLTVGSSGTGTLIVNESGAISVDGGKGAVNIAQASGSTGALVVGAESGDTALGTGSLSAGSVAFGDGSGSVLFNHSDDTGSFEFSTPFTGSGTLTFASGTTVLSADNGDFTGSTNIEGGTLSITGTLPGDVAIDSGGTLSVTGTASGNISVNDGGILSGTGAMTGTVSVADGGTVSPGNSVGTIQTQDVTFEAGSIYSVEIDSDGNADLLQSGGTVTLNGGTVSVSADSYSDSASFTVVSADTAVTGSFSEVTGTSTFIAYTLSYDDTDVILSQTVSSSFASAGATENQLAVGAAVDSLPTAHEVVQHAFGAMSATEARTIFDSLSGETQASLKGALMTSGRKVSEAVNRRLGGTVSDATQVFAYGDTGSAPQHGAWITGYGGWDDIDATANTAAADNKYGGIIAGIDREIGRHWRLGVFGAYGHTETTQSARSSSASADSFTAGAYGGATHGSVFVNIGGLATWHDIDSSRTVTIRRSPQTLTAGYDATSWQVFSEAGYRIDRNNTRIEPFAGISFMQLETDGYTETGGSAALTAAADTESTTFTTLGVRLGRQLTDTVRLHGMAGWRHVFGDVNPTTGFTLAGSIPFTVAGAPIAQDALVIQAGFEVEVSDSLTLGAGYDGQFGDGATSNQFEGHLRLRF